MSAGRRSLWVFLVVGLAVLGGSLYGFSAAEQALPLDAGTAEPREKAAAVTVYVCGAVNKPGVVELPEGARVVDAVKACGDLLPTANAAGINMAQPLSDGAQITVPEKPVLVGGFGAAGPGGGQAAGSAASADGKIHINTADAATLDKLPGIGPAMAARIVEYRAKQGLFQAPEDLRKVRGIGAAKFAALKDRIAL